MWGAKTGLVKAYIAEDFMDYVDWEWKGMDDIDQVARQNGIRLGLENNVLTYREILGNNWKDKLEQTAYEHKCMSDHGITPPSEKMKSGGQTEASKTQSVEVVEDEQV